MQWNHAVLASAVWSLLALGCCTTGVWYVGTRVPAADRERRAGPLGQAAGTLIVVGYAAIWLPYAYQVGKRRREQKQAQAEGQVITLIPLMTHHPLADLAPAVALNQRTDSLDPPGFAY